jgi:hypothetical protein
MQRCTVYLYLETVHVSGGTSTHHQERIQLFTASGICHTVTAICRYRGRVGTGLSVLWVAYATHSTLNFNLVVHSVGQIKDLIISGCTVRL